MPLYLLSYITVCYNYDSTVVLMVRDLASRGVLVTVVRGVTRGVQLYYSTAVSMRREPTPVFETTSTLTQRGAGGQF